MYLFNDSWFKLKTLTGTNHIENCRGFTSCFAKLKQWAGVHNSFSEME